MMFEERHPAAGIPAARDQLLTGGLVIVPTETVYGLAADPFRPEAVQRIYAVKAREAGKPLPLLAADLEQVAAVGGQLDDTERRLARAFWPGPLTLVLRCIPPPAWRPFFSDVEGFRIPDHEIALELLRSVGHVLRVTSANPSHQPPALSAAEAQAVFGGRVDGVLDDGPVRGGVASTVLKVEKTCVRILRPGALARDRIEACLPGCRVETAGA